MAWRIYQYQSRRGDLPLDDYLARLSPKERAVALRFISRLAEFGPQLGEPHVKRLHDPRRQLFELRPGAHRIFFCCVVRNAVVLLHGYRKRSTNTPPRELTTAQRRYDEVVGGSSTPLLGKSQ